MTVSVAELPHMPFHFRQRVAFLAALAATALGSPRLTLRGAVVVMLSGLCLYFLASAYFDKGRRAELRAVVTQRVGTAIWDGTSLLTSAYCLEKGAEHRLADHKCQDAAFHVDLSKSPERLAQHIERLVDAELAATPAGEQTTSEWMCSALGETGCLLFFTRAADTVHANFFYILVTLVVLAVSLTCCLSMCLHCWDRANQTYWTARSRDLVDRDPEAFAVALQRRGQTQTHELKQA